MEWEELIRVPKYDAEAIREMQSKDYPFDANGMTVEEIERFYKNAKDQNEAVGILADCNATTADQMAGFLMARGLITGVPKEKKATKSVSSKTNERLDRFVALADAGKNAQEVAAELGISVNCVYDFCKRHGIRLTRAPRGSNKKEQGDTLKKIGGGVDRNLLPKRPCRALSKRRVPAGRLRSCLKTQESIFCSSASRQKICICGR